MRVIILDNTGLEGIIEVGETYEAMQTKTGRLFISVEGEKLDLTEELRPTDYKEHLELNIFKGLKKF